MELIVHDEINLRHQKRIEVTTRSAEFTKLKTLEDFDGQFNTTVSRKDIYELAAGHFLRYGTDVLFVGPHGKTHLAQTCRGVPVRDHYAPVRKQIHHHDQPPPDRGVG